MTKSRENGTTILLGLKDYKIETSWEVSIKNATYRYKSY